MNNQTFERYVKQAIESLPHEFKKALKNIEIVIEDECDTGPLLGLYEGIPLPERQLGDSVVPDKITIYRGEILRLGLAGKALVDEIRITVLHEIGHYFGLEDDEMTRLGY
jgi:predicted Zn-dependent protease with MMP-like domain